MAHMAFSLWDLLDVDLVASSHTTQCQHYYTLDSSLPVLSLRLNAFNYPWMFQISYVFPSSVLVPLVLSNFLAEHARGQLWLLVLVGTCWMEATWLPTVLNTLADIPWHCIIIKYLVMDVLVGHVLKGLPYLHFTLWLLWDVCCTQGFSPQSVRQWWGQLKCLPAILEGMGRLVYSRGCTKQYHICP